MSEVCFLPFFLTFDFAEGIFTRKTSNIIWLFARLIVPLHGKKNLR